MSRKLLVFLELFLINSEFPAGDWINKSFIATYYSKQHSSIILYTFTCLLPTVGTQAYVGKRRPINIECRVEKEEST